MKLKPKKTASAKAPKTNKTIAAKTAKTKAEPMMLSKESILALRDARVFSPGTRKQAYACGLRDDAKATIPARGVILGTWGYSMATQTVSGVRAEKVLKAEALKPNAVVRISHAIRPNIWGQKYDGAEIRVVAKRGRDGQPCTYMLLRPQEGKAIGKPFGGTVELTCGGTDHQTWLSQFVRWL